MFRTWAEQCSWHERIRNPEFSTKYMRYAFVHHGKRNDSNKTNSSIEKKWRAVTKRTTNIGQLAKSEDGLIPWLGLLIDLQD